MKHLMKAIITVIVILFLGAITWYFYSSEELRSDNASQPEITEETAQQLLSSVPLSFQKNEGQVDEQVEFLVKNGSTTIFFTPKEVVYSIVIGAEFDNKNLDNREDLGGSDKLEQESRTIQVIRQLFINAKDDVVVEGGEELGGKVNYFIGNDQDKWVRNASTFSHIIYKELYQGIDLVYSGKTSLLKYEYHIQPQADYSQIRVKVEGVNKILLSGDGVLVLETETGNIGLKAPDTYQIIDGNRVSLASEYQLFGEDEYGFVVNGHNPDYELIIDPYLQYHSNEQ